MKDQKHFLFSFSSLLAIVLVASMFFANTAVAFSLLGDDDQLMISSMPLSTPANITDDLVFVPSYPLSVQRTNDDVVPDDNQITVNSSLADTFNNTVVDDDQLAINSAPYDVGREVVPGNDDDLVVNSVPFTPVSSTNSGTSLPLDPPANSALDRPMSDFATLFDLAKYLTENGFHNFASVASSSGAMGATVADMTTGDGTLRATYDAIGAGKMAQLAPVLASAAAEPGASGVMGPMGAFGGASGVVGMVGGIVVGLLAAKPVSIITSTLGSAVSSAWNALMGGMPFGGVITSVIPCTCVYTAPPGTTFLVNIAPNSPTSPRSMIYRIGTPTWPAWLPSMADVTRPVTGRATGAYACWVQWSWYCIQVGQGPVMTIVRKGITPAENAANMKAFDESIMPPNMVQR